MVLYIVCAFVCLIHFSQILLFLNYLLPIEDILRTADTLFSYLVHFTHIKTATN